MFVLGVAVRKRLRFPKAPVNEQPQADTFFFHQERCLVTRLWTFLLAKSLSPSQCCLCLASFDVGTASSLDAPKESSTPPQTPRRVVQCFLSGRSATADISWRSFLDLWLQSKRNPMATFVNMYRCRERAGSGTWASLQRCSSASALSDFLLPLNLDLVFPLYAATQLSSPPRSSDASLV